MENQVHEQNQLKQNELNQDQYYNQVIQIWQLLCELHSHLYQITCNEYTFLLNSNMEKIEESLNEKEATIEKIKKVELARSNLIAKINETLSEENKLKSAGQLSLYFANFPKEVRDHFFSNYNSLLIEIIEKIQEQNKKNQVLLGRGLSYFKQMKELVNGAKLTIYNSQGQIHHSPRK
jgi:flagellar biosynthesis/type III secretory pathway chaperone